MNEKEAKEIYALHLDGTNLACECRDGELAMECYEAKGYLEAIEKAEGLVEAYKDMISGYVYIKENHGPLSGLGISRLDKWKETLAKFEKEA